MKMRRRLPLGVVGPLIFFLVALVNTLPLLPIAASLLISAGASVVGVLLFVPIEIAIRCAKDENICRMRVQAVIHVSSCVGLVAIGVLMSAIVGLLYHDTAQIMLLFLSLVIALTAAIIQHSLRVHPTIEPQGENGDRSILT
jgi:hypothetical protein